MQADKIRQTWNLRRPMVIGVGMVVLALTFLGLWASWVQIDGAVIGTGTIEVSTTRTAVQHPIGGVVVEIRKREGDHVAAGEVILRLDDRQLRSNLVVVEGALYETLVNIARLEAGARGKPRMALDPVLEDAVARDDSVRSLIADHQRQLNDFLAGMETKKRLLDEQSTQTQSQIAGVAAQLRAKHEEAAIVATELAKAKALSAQGLIRDADLSALDKARVTAQGEIGRLQALMAELDARISETRLKALSVDTDARELIGVELSRMRPERTRLLEARSSILEDLSRLEIRSPVGGTIIDSKVLGLRSVVVAAGPLMMVVPEDEPVRARVRVWASDVDQVFVGQIASLKFKAFNGRQVPIILGSVLQISADAFLDPRTQKAFYEVTVALDDAELAKLGQRELIPGMPVEAFLATESRTPLSYLMRPILFYFDRAFRDA